MSIDMKESEITEPYFKEHDFKEPNSLVLTDENIKNLERIQIEYADKVVKEDMFDLKEVRYVGGLNLCSDRQDESRGVSYITIYDIIEKKIVYEDHILCTLDIPYISGLLGFREVPGYIELLKKVKQTDEQYYPDVVMIYGFGILHYRGFGSASQIGYETGIPTIGLGKTLLQLDGLDEKNIKENFRKTCTTIGNYKEMIGTSGKVYGAAYKSTETTGNPIYITIGHNISLESAGQIVSMTCEYKTPEPLRNSDIKSKLLL
jgi:deoxyinosine 3'endonuclease (endonuclease V)